MSNSQKFVAKSKLFLSSLVVLGLLAAGCKKNITLPSPQPAKTVTSLAASSYSTPLHIAQQTILVEIAGTDAAREQGLSGREPLTDNQGMLFDFRNTDTSNPGFWMKDMKFNLDLVWINKNRVVGITSNIAAPQTAQSPLPVYYSPSDVDMVLEVNSDWSVTHNIKIDGVVNF